MEFTVGLGRHDITCFIPGLGMMGYGQPHNIVKEVATPLMGRALILKHDSVGPFIHVHLELAFAAQSVKEAILSEINSKFPDWEISDDRLLITAQHTHSAPGGYTHYPFYNFTVPHHQTRVLKTIVEGAMGAITEAKNSLAPGILSFGEIQIPSDKEVAFNRSLVAYANNKNAKALSPELAVDRRMRGLLIHSPEGKLRGALNWFGVHCTSISSYNQRIHHDNKGIAADLFERAHPGCIALFLQSAAGDISPNFIWDKSIKRTRGKFEDQYDNAAFNGEIQFREAQRIIAKHRVGGALRFALQYSDLTRLAEVPAHGVAFFRGTLEGPGVPALGPLLTQLSRLVRTLKLNRSPQEHKNFYDNHFPKDVLLDHRDGSFAGLTQGLWKRLPPIPHPTLEALRKMSMSGALKTLPWVPTILPFQLVQIGRLLIATVPGEITTMAAERLETKLKLECADLGVTEVIITSYANAYMGYITTPEEYDLQCYEGGHTVYGRKTLDAVLEAFTPVVQDLRTGDRPLEPLLPFHYPPDELTRRSV
jgi:neutral ceramidase